MIARSTTAITTDGVYHFANFVIKSSLLDLLEAAPSISSSTLAAVDSDSSLSTRTLSVPLRLIQPDRTLSPTVTSLGSDSPVSADVLMPEVPSITVPSSGIRSPALTTMMSPTCTSSGVTVTTPPPRSRFALSGQISINWEIEARLFPTASLWRNSPILYRSITRTASMYSPTQIAPIEAMVIRKFSSRN